MGVPESEGETRTGCEWWSLGVQRKCMRLNNMHKTVCMFVTAVILLGRGQRLAKAYWHLQVAVSTALYAS